MNPIVTPLTSEAQRREDAYDQLWVRHGLGHYSPAERGFILDFLTELAENGYCGIYSRLMREGMEKSKEGS